jgi:hypothetical protein
MYAGLNGDSRVCSRVVRHDFLDVNSRTAIISSRMVDISDRTADVSRSYKWSCMYASLTGDSRICTQVSVEIVVYVQGSYNMIFWTSTVVRLSSAVVWLTSAVVRLTSAGRTGGLQQICK